MTQSCDFADCFSAFLHVTLTVPLPPFQLTLFLTTTYRNTHRENSWCFGCSIISVFLKLPSQWHKTGTNYTTDTSLEFSSRKWAEQISSSFYWWLNCMMHLKSSGGSLQNAQCWCSNQRALKKQPEYKTTVTRQIFVTQKKKWQKHLLVINLLFRVVTPWDSNLQQSVIMCT